MKVRNLLLLALLACSYTFSYGQQPSKEITEKGIFPGPNKTPNQAVVPSLTDDENTDGSSSTDPSTTPSNPSDDEEYTPKASPTPKGDKEYFPSATSPNIPKGNKEYFPKRLSTNLKI